jgi:hypothetical protein
MNRYLRIVCSTLFSAALIGCAGSSPGDSQESTDPLQFGKGYLALGDSVAFGYNPVDAVNDPTNLKAFVGYPELISLSGIPVANASCEGETTSSFMAGPPDHGCFGWRTGGDAMHVPYVNSPYETQLQFALGYLATHPNTATVTVGIGANDLLMLQDKCIANPAPYPDPLTCIGAQAPGVIKQAASNVATILGAIRTPGAFPGYPGYTGQLAVVTYYALNYSNPADPNLQSIYGLDQAIVTAAQTLSAAPYNMNISVAKGFTAFGAIANVVAAGDSCAAGLLYPTPNGPTKCDKHPSALGQATLAAAVAAAVPASSIDLTVTPAQF